MPVTIDAGSAWARGLSGGDSPDSGTWATGNELVLVIADSISRPSDVGWCTVYGPIFSIAANLGPNCQLWGFNNFNAGDFEMGPGMCSGTQTFYAAGPTQFVHGYIAATVCLALRCGSSSNMVTDGTTVSKRLGTPTGEQFLVGTVPLE